MKSSTDKEHLLNLLKNYYDLYIFFYIFFISAILYKHPVCSIYLCILSFILNFNLYFVLVLIRYIFYCL